MTRSLVRTGLADELPHLRRYALSLTRDAESAEDLVQDTALKAVERAPVLRTRIDLRRWLFTVLRNGAIDAGRRARRRGHAVEVSEVGANALGRPPAQENHIRLCEVIARMADLDPGQSECLRLSVVEGQDHAAIAARMNVAVGTVKSRLCRARARLAA